MTVRDVPGDVYKALLDEDENFLGYDPKYVGMFPGLSSPCIFTLCTHGYGICPVSHDQCVCVCVCVFCYHTHVARVAYIPHTVFCTSIFPLCRKRFTDKHNQDVVSRLVSEAGKLDCNIPVIQLRGNHCVCLNMCVL